jgi:GTP:adenosylcobinamide-phosphate guanylyltransferase
LPSNSSPRSWDGLILAAGRGPADPMSQAYAVTHKCLLPVAGKPMLQHVVGALRAAPLFRNITISVEHADLPEGALGPFADAVNLVPSGNSASLSVARAFDSAPLRPPVLVTTADHPLLRQDIIAHFLAQSTAANADLTVGLATAEVILAAYPHVRRTFLSFGSERVSGCNLYAFNTASALKIIGPWHELEDSRKRPWRLVGALGLGNLISYLLGSLSLERAFDAASRRLGIVVKPVLLPFAESAIDVDKPADLELAESILRSNDLYQPAII